MNTAFVASAPLLKASPRRASTVVAAPRMSVAPVRRAAARASASLTALAVAAPALATEGTGEGLGIDNALLYIPLLGIPAVFLFLFLQFGSSQVRALSCGCIPFDTAYGLDGIAVCL